MAFRDAECSSDDMLLHGLIVIRFLDRTASALVDILAPSQQIRPSTLTWFHRQGNPFRVSFDPCACIKPVAAEVYVARSLEVSHCECEGVPGVPTGFQKHQLWRFLMHYCATPRVSRHFLHLPYRPRFRPGLLGGLE